MGNSLKTDSLLDLEEIIEPELVTGDIISDRKLSNIYKGIWKQQSVTIKSYKEDVPTKEIFCNECAIIKNLNHPNILRIFGILSVKKPFRIVFESIGEGTLLDYLRARKKPYFDLNNSLLVFAAQIASAVNYLHDNNVIHCDLAARNVFVTENYNLKLWNFGMAKYLGDNDQIIYTGKDYAIKWAAPEVIKFGKYSTKSDAWSFGMLLIELFTYGKVLFRGKSDDEVKEIILGQKFLSITLKQPKNIPADLYREITNCWELNPEQRPSFEFLQNYFENYEVKRHKKYFCGENYQLANKIDI